MNASPRGPGPDAERDERDVERAAAALEERLGGWRPRVAITMGSGLGALADRFVDPVAVPYEALPGWPRPTVEGHVGRAVAGRLGDVLGFAGRVHLYEGHPPARVAFYVRVLARLGVARLFLSNAAGAIRDGFRPGELMLIRDHLDLTFRSPLAGPVREGEERFPDMSSPYDPALQDSVRRAARDERIRLHEGVYAAMLGPAYETPAEIRMLDRFGADAVGMSTVPEVIAARALGIRCVAVSCLTNWAAGTTPEPLDHEEVLETAARAADEFERLVTRAVGEMAEMA